MRARERERNERARERGNKTERERDRESFINIRYFIIAAIMCQSLQHNNLLIGQ